MRKWSVLVIIIILFASTISYVVKSMTYKQKIDVTGILTASSPQSYVHVATYERIISLAPSITEVLFALGLGDRVVGVTRYCKFPPEAVAKAKIGGYSDPNYEAIITLDPDLVIMLPEHRMAKQYLARFGLTVLVVNHDSISGILNSIITIGKTCGVEQNARSLVHNLQTKMESIRRKTKGLYHPRVMISVGRGMGSGSLNDVYISGRDSFYNEMINLAGGTNAYTGKVPIPVVTKESIIRMNPEVIIDMVPDLNKKGWSKAMILKKWKSLSQVDAVKNNRVFVFGQDYVVIPGPRFILVLEEMAKAIHPELNWR